MWKNQDLFNLQKEDPIVVLKYCRYIYDKASEEQNQMSELVIEDPRIKNSQRKDISRAVMKIEGFQSHKVSGSRVVIEFSDDERRDRAAEQIYIIIGEETFQLQFGRSKQLRFDHFKSVCPNAASKIENEWMKQFFGLMSLFKAIYNGQNYQKDVITQLSIVGVRFSEYISDCDFFNY